MINKKIVIIGGGISGLIAGNYLKREGKCFTIISLDDHGFSNNKTNDFKFKFKLGQRTLFHENNFHAFISNICYELHSNGDLGIIQSLKDSIGVYYKSKIHNYPIQYNLNKLPIYDAIKFYLSYWFRNKKHSGDYLSWTKANYGSWLSNEILLPHTWKTIKEDLSQIDCLLYGKKVIPMKMFGNGGDIKAFINSSEIISALRENVKDHIKYGKVVYIDTDKKIIKYDPNPLNIADLPPVYIDSEYDILINTMPINKLMSIIETDDMLDVALNSLQWNNMFAAIFVLPTKLVKIDKNILYFPEKDYVFSKINRERKNGYTVLVCECSFRRNDRNKFENAAYRYKFLDRVEHDLRKSGVIDGDIISAHYRDWKIVDPCYIITDHDYKVSNNFIQSYCEHNNIYNVGRFAQFVPNLRAEHSLERMEELWQLCLEDA